MFAFEVTYPTWWTVHGMFIDILHVYHLQGRYRKFSKTKTHSAECKK